MPDLSAEAWHAQAIRDLRAAEHLLQGDFPAHASGLAHLAVEKALKGWIRAASGRTPPVTHDLRTLADRIGLGRSVDGWTADLDDGLDVLGGAGLLSLYAPDRPFGHPLSEATDVARERVAAAQALVTWIGTHRDDA